MIVENARRLVFKIFNIARKSRKITATLLIVKLIMLLVMIRGFGSQGKEELIDASFGSLGQLVKRVSSDWSPGGVIKRFTLITYERNEIPSYSNSLNMKNVQLFAYSNCISKESECVVTQPLPVHINVGNLTVCCHTEQDVACDRIKQNGTNAEAKPLSLLWATFVKDPELQFIDIGANVGFMSLFAASMGKKVLAVEPLGINLNPFCHSVLLNRYTDLIRIVRAAVSNTRRTLVMEVPKGAYNKAHVQSNQRNSKERPPAASDEQTSTAKVPAVLLDDLIAVADFRKAIMKINIEGYEPFAFRNASELFSVIYIPVVIMKWSNLQYQLRRGSKEPYSVADFYHSRNYSAYADIPGAKLLVSNAHQWGNQVFWIHQPFLQSFDQSKTT